MNVAIIAAAGQGTRMAGSRPKQFLELAGTPILIHTLRAFERCDVIQKIVVVAPEQQAAEVLKLNGQYGLQKLARVVAGGSTRAASVFNGLRSVDDATTEIVVVHDGVRPFVTPEEIASTVEAASKAGAAILVSRPVDTIKQVSEGNVIKTLQRDQLRNALTPQSFRYTLLLQAYEQVDVLDPALTDESSILERMGVSVAIVEGSARNIKITTAEDLVVGEAILKMRR
jgi:2-C-methyl-D-erythritol 4-phosphate cytidylyltransferase